MSVQIKIIINADDYGWNIENDKTITQLFQSQSISSASVLITGTNVPYVQQFTIYNELYALELAVSLTFH